MGSSRKKTTRAREHEQQAKQLTSRREQVDTVRHLIQRYQSKLEKVLPSYLTAERMIEIVMTEIARTPQLLECTQSSLIGCIIQCAQLGLQPGIVGECYLIPYRNKRKNVVECTLIPGYKGLLKLAWNSGEIASVHCDVVYEKDSFDYQYGTSGFCHHRPYEGDERGKMTHAYALVSMVRSPGVFTWEVFPRNKVMAARKSSRAAESGQSPWSTHEDEMWMKTVLRHTCKRLPASVDKIAAAVALDERADAGIPQGLGALAPELPELPANAPAPDDGDGDEGGNDEPAPNGSDADTTGGESQAE